MTPLKEIQVSATEVSDCAHSSCGQGPSSVKALRESCKEKKNAHIISKLEFVRRHVGDCEVIYGLRESSVVWWEQNGTFVFKPYIKCNPIITIKTMQSLPWSAVVTAPKRKRQVARKSEGKISVCRCAKPTETYPHRVNAAKAASTKYWLEGVNYLFLVLYLCLTVALLLHYRQSAALPARTQISDL